MTIEKDTLIGEIVKLHPKAVPVLLENGMHCVGCHVATWETIEQAAHTHSLDLKKLLKQLNEAVR